MADNTWKFLEHQESNPEALKQAVDTLIGYTKKKGFAGAENAQLDSLELVKHVIICEAAAPDSHPEESTHFTHRHRLRLATLWILQW